MHVSAVKKKSGCQELNLQGFVSQPNWVLRTELECSAIVARVLTC